MENFTPYSALIGGAIIGLSAVLLLLGAGRIAGISGILNGIIDNRRGDLDWRILFVVGIPLGALIQFLTLGMAFEPRTGFSPVLLAVAGFLVGFGTRMGSGCTSGHGVCGIGRLSHRSIVATLTFMAAGFATTFVIRHLIGG